MVPDKSVFFTLSFYILKNTKENISTYWCNWTLLIYPKWYFGSFLLYVFNLKKIRRFFIHKVRNAKTWQLNFLVVIWLDHKIGATSSLPGKQRCPCCSLTTLVVPFTVTKINFKVAVNINSLIQPKDGWQNCVTSQEQVILQCFP